MVIISTVTIIKTDTKWFVARDYCSVISKVFRQWQMGDVFWLSTFAQEMKEKKETKSSSGRSKTLHAGVIKFSFCALNINE